MSTKGGYRIHDQDGLYFVTFTIVQWLDVFIRPNYVQILIDSIKYCQKEKGLIVHAYCIMSSHIHLIISQRGDQSLSDIIRDLKKYTSNNIYKAIEENPRESRKSWMVWIFKSNGEFNRNNENHQFWIHGFHPVALYSRKFIVQRIHYIHQNPVKAKLVYQAEDYVWSSASVYAGYDLENHLDIEVLDAFYGI